MEERFDLYETYGTLIIAKNKQFICAIDRFTLEEVSKQPIPLDDQSKIPFLFILGLYKYENRFGDNIYFLVLVTEVEKSDFYNVCEIKKFEIIPLKYNTKRLEDSEKFQELLKLGLNHCSMYYSDSYNLSLTFQQQFEKLPSRPFFIWNYTAIDRLKNIWPTASCFKEVIAGYFRKEDPFVLISRKSNKNGGCHTWNRGADANGMCANFIENEEIMILNSNEQGINAISHIEVGASCPFFWSQYPTMHLHRPIHVGPQEENERRFNLHFDHLCETYFGDKNNKSLVIISLLGNKGKEVQLNTIYKELAEKRGIEFKHINFNNLMKKENGLTDEVDKLKNELDACIVENGIVKQKQTKMPRINCASCLDRTSVFMEILFRSIFSKYEPNVMEENIKTHKNLWLIRADIISKQYAITRGEKTYMIETNKKTLKGRYHDYSISWQRFFYSIFYEGKYCDAINAVLQEKPFTSFDPTEKQIFKRLILFFQLVFLFIYLYIFQGRECASKIWSEKIKTIINHPHIPDLRDADEIDNVNSNETNDESIV